MKKMKVVIQEQKELTMDFLTKLNEIKWPRFPILPVKRYVKGRKLPELGIIYSNDITTVKQGNYLLGNNTGMVLQIRNGV